MLFHLVSSYSDSHFRNAPQKWLEPHILFSLRHQCSFHLSPDTHLIKSQEHSAWL